MIPRLQEIDPHIGNEVNDAVLLCQATRPRTCRQIPERLRFSDPHEWITHDGFDKIERTQRDPPIGFDPMPKVFAKLRLKHGDTNLLCCHAKLLIKAEVAAKFRERLRPSLALLRSGQRCEKPFRILG